MNYKKNKQKTNPLFIISILLCIVFLFIIIIKLNFIYKQVEGVLIDQKTTQGNQKFFNINLLKQAKEKMLLD